MPALVVAFDQTRERNCRAKGRSPHRAQRHHAHSMYGLVLCFAMCCSSRSVPVPTRPLVRSKIVVAMQHRASTGADVSCNTKRTHRGSSCTALGALVCSKLQWKKSVSPGASEHTTRSHTCSAIATRSRSAHISLRATSCKPMSKKSKA